MPHYHRQPSRFYAAPSDQAHAFPLSSVRPEGPTPARAHPTPSSHRGSRRVEGPLCRLPLLPGPHAGCAVERAVFLRSPHPRRQGPEARSDALGVGAPQEAGRGPLDVGVGLSPGVLPVGTCAEHHGDPLGLRPPPLFGGVWMKATIGVGRCCVPPLRGGTGTVSCKVVEKNVQDQRDTF
jgi:hypothetical protein